MLTINKLTEDLCKNKIVILLHKATNVVYQADYKLASKSLQVYAIII